MRWAMCMTAVVMTCASWAQQPAEQVIADFETGAQGVEGVELDTEVAHGGQASARWDDHPQNSSVQFTQAPADWSGFDNLELWLRTDRATDAQFMMIIQSENPETDGIDYWSHKFTLDWTGWRHFRFPRAEFGHGARQPLGWDQVTRFYLTSSGWGCEPDEDTVVWIDDVRLTNDAVRAQVVGAVPVADGQAIAATHEVRVRNRLDRALTIRPVLDAPEGVQARSEPEELSLEAGGRQRLDVTVRFDRQVLGDHDAMAEGEVVVRLDAGEGRSPVELRLPLTATAFAGIDAGPHPRLLLNDRLVGELRGRVETQEWAAETAERLIAGADGIIDRYADGIPEDELASIERGRDLTARAESLAMAYLLTDEERYAHAAARLITAAKQWSTWVYEFHAGIPADLGTAGALRHFACAYDWAWRGMTDAERRDCAETIGIGLDLWRDAIEGNVWWSRSYRTNWCAVCCGGGGLAAVALMDERDDAAQVLAEAYPRIVRFLNEGGVDGGWPEGTGYWGYGVSHAALLADAVRIITGGRMDLFEHPYLQATWQFPLYFHCPPAGTINFADCGYGLPNRELTLQIGARTGEPHAVWYFEQFPGYGRLPLVWYDEQLASRLPTDLPQSIHLRGIDWAALRSGWDPDATIVGLRGGNNGENHGMLECGNFTVNSRGERLIMDHGAAQYTHEYFSGDRWDFYRASSHGANVVLVDNADQLPGRDAAGTITDFFTSEGFDYLCLDATGAYPDFVQSIQRRVVFLKPDLLVMLDDVRADGERTYEWRCHPTTAGEVVLGADRMAVENGRAALAARWLLPEALSIAEGGEDAAGSEKEGVDYNVSVTPEQAAGQMRFLTVLRCHDAAGARALFEMAPGERQAAGQRAPRVLLIMGAEASEWRVIRDLIRAQGIAVDWVGEDRLEALPEDASGLAAYAAVLLVPTGGGASALSLAQMQALATYVRDGGGLILGAGTESFGAGGFDDTPLADLLPVRIVRDDDNVTHVRQSPVVVAADHPVLEGLPGQWPEFGSAYGAYYDVRLADDATELLRVQPDVAEADVPFIAAGEVGEGRALMFGALWAFSTGEQFKTWEHAGRFFANAIGWLSHGRAQPDPSRDLSRAILAPEAFPLGDGELARAEVSGGVGCRLSGLPGDAVIAFATGEEPIEVGPVSADARAIAFVGTATPERTDDVMAAAGATRVAVGDELLSADRPVSAWFTLPEEGRIVGLVQCDAETSVSLAVSAQARVQVDGEPAAVRQTDRGTTVDLDAGRHRIEMTNAW